jgi:muramoyltetrapeptide carboxypeptidase
MQPLVIPLPLKPGDPVGVIAASGPPAAEMLDQGLGFLDRAGFRVHTGNHLYQCCGYLAGTDEQRCQDLNDMLAHKDVRGVFFARGGYGVMRLLETLDYKAAARYPKLLLGMSDVTALSLALYAKSGLVTWAGPMLAGQVAEGLDDLSHESLVSALTTPLMGRTLLPKNYPCRVTRPGTASGPLLGGCLSLVTSLLGTPYAPDFTGAILLLEDVSEPLYRLDRMLTHLKLAGVLTVVGAIVLGHFVGPDGNDLSAEVAEIVLELTRECPVPVLSGFPHGHVLPNLTLPHGAVVELTCSPPALTVRPDQGPLTT